MSYLIYVESAAVPTSVPQLPSTPSPERKAPRRQSYREGDKEFEERMEATDENKLVIHAGIAIKYAWVSQRGYYPNG